MCFEDYGGYFPHSEGDEELWAEADQNERVLFYQARTKSPPRETQYGFFLDRDLLDREPALARIFRGLVQDLARLQNLPDGEPGPIRPEELGVGFFEALRPMVVEARYFELDHLTSESLDGALGELGFTDVRHFDHRLPELLSLVDTAREAGRLDELALLFPLLAELRGAAAVRSAGSGPGDVAIAKKRD